MKHAQLWKRVLHEGVNLRDYPAEYARSKVLAAQIITTGPCDRADGASWSDDGWRGASIAPPFDRFWIEAGPFPNDGGYVGVLVLKKPEWPSDEEYIARDGSLSTDHFLRCVCVSADALTPPSVCGMGMIMCNDSWAISAVSRLTHDRPGESEKFYEALTYALSCLRFLSCKNVSLAPRDNEPKTVRTATKWHGPSATGYRYHVLVVRPPGARSDSPGVEIGNMPRHVCRGHFAEYGPKFNKGLLFGKYAGRFYVPPHLKGDAKNGTVYKDYQIGAAS